jgi:hypothetical protein
VRQLSPGALALSPRLHSADPAGVGRWAASTRTAAHALDAGARRLAHLCSVMPSGLWRSPAASVFDGAGQEQTRRLRVVAAMFEQLAAVAARLAAELGQARGQALTAVARGTRLDIEVHVFNGRMRAQHALLPQDPDSLLDSEPEADELSGQLAAAAGALADAEARARNAWQTAAAALISSAMRPRPCVSA